ncbi:sterol desaturase family protein [Fluviispira multicolorata]|nr:sterol desaturase family protein [Fluviispira multicolorata]
MNFLFAATSYIIARVFSYPIIYVFRGLFGDIHIGLFKYIHLNYLYILLISFIILDYSQYIWHRFNHIIPFFWRFHKVHHSDSELDSSTAFRFHFGEQFFSQFFRFIVVILFFIPLEFVLIYDFISLFFIIFHHSNIKFKYDNIFSNLIVTPYIHTIHHSKEFNELNSNFSVIFSFWDRIHRTLNKRPDISNIKIGLIEMSERDAKQFWEIFFWPFKKKIF